MGFVAQVEAQMALTVSDLSYSLQLALTAARAGKNDKKVILYKYQFNQLAWTLFTIFIVVFQVRNTITWRSAHDNDMAIRTLQP